MDTYYTLAGCGESEFVEKRSRFLGFAYPISSVDEALEYVTELKRKYYDARHACWAYRMGVAGEVYRSNDDGEPSGSAGKPILGRIIASELSDVLVVVVRYFGGVKLGTGGLVVAYRTAAAEALGMADKREVVLKTEIEVLFDYALMGDVMRIVKDSMTDVFEQDFRETCRLILSVRQNEVSVLAGRLRCLFGVIVKPFDRS